MKRRFVAADVAGADAEGLGGTGDRAIPQLAGLLTVENDIAELVDFKAYVCVQYALLLFAVDEYCLKHFKPLIGNLDLLELLVFLLVQQA